MKRFLNYRAALSFIVCLALIVVASTRGSAQIDKAELLTRAQKQYYNLRSVGVAELSCKVSINWARMLKDMTDNGSAPDGVSPDMLSQVRFTMSLGANDMFIFERPADPMTPDKETQDNIRMLLDESEQMLGSFSSAWKPFVLTPIFPEPASVENIAETDTGYRVLAKDGDLKTELSMTKDMVISDITVRSLLLTGTTMPTFTKTDKGLLLKKLDSNIGDGQIKSTITIDYQEIQGIQVLKYVLYDGTDRGVRHVIELSFSDYVIKKKS